jgi:adenosylcobinamide amidohydrolase
MDMVIHTLKNGDRVHRFDGNIVIEFEGKRKVLATSPHNGGYTEHLKAVFNHDGRCGLGVPSKMKAPTYREHNIITIQEIGLDVETTAGLETAAHMENVSIQSASYEDIVVTAIVTGGIEVNGGRAGDPSFYTENDLTPPEHRLGTINILLAVNADMSLGCMARALVTCTEAKTVAIQELQARSHYSRGIATGSGTDGTIIIADAESKHYMTNAGKHSKLGELIAKAVIPAVKEALYLQTGLCPERQHNAVNRLERFGVTEEKLYQIYAESVSDNRLSRPEFSDRMEQLAVNSDAVVQSSLLAHLMDQMDWGLLTVDETLHAAHSLLNHTWNDMSADNPDAAVQEIIANWYQMMISRIVSFEPRQ